MGTGAALGMEGSGGTASKGLRRQLTPGRSSEEGDRPQSRGQLARAETPEANRLALRGTAPTNGLCGKLMVRLRIFDHQAKLPMADIRHFTKSILEARLKL